MYRQVQNFKVVESLPLESRFSSLPSGKQDGIFTEHPSNRHDFPFASWQATNSCGIDPKQGSRWGWERGSAITAVTHSAHAQDTSAGLFALICNPQLLKCVSRRNVADEVRFKNISSCLVNQGMKKKEVQVPIRHECQTRESFRLDRPQKQVVKLLAFFQGGGLGSSLSQEAVSQRINLAPRSNASELDGVSYDD